ncbi:hypothetical protein GCM10027444_10930 [Actinopolyspora lacussalsi]
MRTAGLMGGALYGMAVGDLLEEVFGNRAAHQSSAGPGRPGIKDHVQPFNWFTNILRARKSRLRTAASVMPKTAAVSR